MRRFSIAVLLFTALCAVHLANCDSAAAQSARAEVPADWVNELEPGVRIIGRENPFSKVNNSHLYLVHPDSKHLLFFDHQQISKWDIESQEVISRKQLTPAFETANFTPDGKTIVGTQRSQGSAYPQKLMLVFVDANSLEKFRTVEIQRNADLDPPANRNTSSRNGQSYGYVAQIAFSRDGKQMAFGYQDRLFVHDVESGKKMLEIPVKHGYQRGVAFVDRDRALITAVDNQVVEMYEVATGELLEKSPVTGARSSRILSHPKRELVMFTASADMVGYDFDQNRKLKLPAPRNSQCASGEFTPDGQHFVGITNSWDAAASTATWTLNVWDLETNKPIRKFPLGNSPQMRTVRVSRDAKRIFVHTSGLPGVMTFSMDDDQQNTALQYFASAASSVAVHPTGEFFAATAGDGISIVNSTSGEILRKIDVAYGSSMDMSKDGKSLLVNRRNIWPSRIEKIKIANGQIQQTISISNRPPTPSVDQSGSLDIDVVGLFKRALGAEDPEKAPGTQSAPQMIYPATVNHVVFTPENNINAIVTGPGRNNVSYRKWDGETAQVMTQQAMEVTPELESRAGEVPAPYRSSCLSPNGERVAVCGNREISIYDSETGQLLGDIPARSWRCQFSPDNRYLVLTTGQQIEVWDWRDRTRVAAPSGNHGTVLFNQRRNQMWVVPYSSNAPITAYDLDSWTPVWKKTTKLTNRTAAALSEDGNRLVFGMQDCRIQVWDLNRLMP